MSLVVVVSKLVAKQRKTTKNDKLKTGSKQQRNLEM